MQPSASGCRRCRDDTHPLHKAASSGHLDCFVYLLKKGNSIFTRNREGSLPLHNACFYGHKDIVKYILDDTELRSQVHEKNNFLSIPLHSAAFNGHTDVARLLLNNGSRVDSTDKDGASPLHKAAFQGGRDIINLLLSEGADVNKSDSEGASPLHLASYNGRSDAVEVLLSKKSCNVLHRDSSGATALHKASFNGHAACVSLLLDSDIPVDTLDSQGMSPLHLASFNGHLDCLRLLLKKGACVWRHDHQGGTPLHYSSYGGFVDAIDILVQSGAEIDARDLQGFTVPGLRAVSWTSGGVTALVGACFFGKIDSVRKLLASGARSEVRGPRQIGPVHAAAMGGDIAVLEALLQAGIAIDEKDADGSTPLHAAIKAGKVDVARFLVKKGASISAADGEGSTPLHLASSTESRKLVRRLIDRGASVDSKDNNGNTPLHRACQQGQSRVVSRLLDAGATKDAVDINSRTPLHFASISGSLSILEDLCNAGADLQPLDSTGSTPLMYACQHAHVDVVKELLRRGVILALNDKDRDKDGRGVMHRVAIGGDARIARMVMKDVGDGALQQADLKGVVPLHIACEHGHVELIEYFLKHGADPLSRDTLGNFPLHYAARLNKSTLIKILLQKNRGLSTECKDGNWNTPLHVASSLGHLKTVGALLSKKASTSSVTYTGKHPLHVAAEFGHHQVCKALLDAGAVPSAIDSSGATALHCACIGGHSAVVSTLIAGGAVTSQQNAKGDTPLHEAASNGHDACVRIILETAGDVGARNLVKLSNKEGFFPIHVAKSVGCAKLLLETGKGLIGIGFPSNITKELPLHVAARFGNAPLVAFYDRCAADFSAKSKSGDTILHAAAVGGNVQIIKAVLNRISAIVSISINTTNAKGQTPIHAAIEAGQSSAVQILLDHGADLDCIPQQQQSPPMAVLVTPPDSPLIKTPSSKSGSSAAAAHLSSPPQSPPLQLLPFHLSPTTHARSVSTPPVPTSPTKSSPYKNSPITVPSILSAASTGQYSNTARAFASSSSNGLIRLLTNPLFNPSALPFTEDSLGSCRLHKLLALTTIEQHELVRLCWSAIVRRVITFLLSSAFVFASMQSLPMTEADWASASMADMYFAIGEAHHLARLVIQEEVRNTVTANTLFRGNSLASKVLTQCARAVGASYLYATLREPLSRVAHSKEPCEVDPAKLAEGEDIAHNVARLTHHCDAFLSSILASVDRLPTPLRLLCCCLREAVTEKFGDAHSMPAVGGFFFLRWLVPNIVSPPSDLFKLDETTSSHVRRTLLLVSNVIQTISNRQEFGAKAPYMMPLNAYVAEKLPLVNDFLLAVSAPSKKPAARCSQGMVYRDPATSINKLYSYLHTADQGKILQAVGAKNKDLADSLSLAIAEIGNAPLVSTSMLASSPSLVDHKPVASTSRAGDPTWWVRSGGSVGGLKNLC